MLGTTIQKLGAEKPEEQAKEQELSESKANKASWDIVACDLD